MSSSDDLLLEPSPIDIRSRRKRKPKPVSRYNPLQVTTTASHKKAPAKRAKLLPDDYYSSKVDYEDEKEEEEDEEYDPEKCDDEDEIEQIEDLEEELLNPAVDWETRLKLLPDTTEASQRAEQKRNIRSIQKSEELIGVILCNVMATLRNGFTRLSQTARADEFNMDKLVAFLTRIQEQKNYQWSLSESKSTSGTGGGHIVKIVIECGNKIDRAIPAQFRNHCVQDINGPGTGMAHFNNALIVPLNNKQVFNVAL